MLGTFINAAGVLGGALAGRALRGNLSPAVQNRARVFLSGAAVVTGAAVLWRSLPSQILPALVILFLAAVSLSLGSLTGHLLGLQRGFGRLTSWAARDGAGRERSGFALEAVVLTASPLGIAGALIEGWTGDWRPLALKAALDTLAAVGFTASGSRTVALAAIPVVAVQGTLTLGGILLARMVPAPGPAMAMGVCTGLLVLTTVPMILGLRRVPVANYLPALLYAPLLAAWWS